MTREIYDVKKLATILHKSESTIRYLAKNGDIPHFKVGRSYMFPKDVIDKFISSQLEPTK